MAALVVAVQSRDNDLTNTHNGNEPTLVTAGIEPVEAPVDVSVASESEAASGQSDSSTVDSAAVELTVQNTGGQPALITEVEVKVNHLWRLPGCEGGPLVSTANYDVRLSPDAYERATPFSVRAPRQDFKVPPNDIQRFTVSIGPETTGESPWAPISAVEIILHERTSGAISAGSVVLMSAWATDSVPSYLAGGGAAQQHAECVQDHVNSLFQAASYEGKKSPAIDELKDGLAQRGWGVDQAPTGVVRQQQGSSTTNAASPPTRAATGGDPGTDFAEGWVAQLSSFPESLSPEEIDLRRSELQLRYRIPVHVTSSRDYPSLRPGFWIAYHGPMESGRETLSLCGELGLNEDSLCVGRYLSGDTRDREIICRPSQGPESRGCTRE